MGIATPLLVPIVNSQIQIVDHYTDAIAHRCTLALRFPVNLPLTNTESHTKPRRATKGHTYSYTPEVSWCLLLLAQGPWEGGQQTGNLQAREWTIGIGREDIHSLSVQGALPVCDARRDTHLLVRSTVTTLFAEA